MKKKKAAVWILGLLVASMVFQTGAAVYALVAKTNENITAVTDTVQDMKETVPVESLWNKGEEAAEVDISISQEVLDKAKIMDPSLYEQNITNFKKLLTVLNVHPTFQNELERLIQANHRLPDLMIAYEYLYHNFGRSKDIESFVTQRESGKSWKTIFEDYSKTHAPFVPQAFDSDELEQLMGTKGLTSDDIMLADRISFETGKTFKELIDMKLQEQAPSWKEINVQLTILFSASVLPRVRITNEDVQKYTQNGKMSPDQVAEAFVIAYQLGEQPKSIVEQFVNGSTAEGIYADILSSKYNK